MFVFSLRWAVAIAFTLVTAGTASCYPFEDLLKRIPDGANLMMLVNVRGLQRSSMGVSRDWAEKRRRDYLGGLVPFPPTVSRIVGGKHLDTTSLQSTGRVRLIDLTEPMTPTQLLQRESGTMDTVAGLKVVITPRGRAHVFVTSKLVAELDTVDRQEIARWIRVSSQKTRPTLSKFLEEAAEGMKPGAQILLAVDLTDVPHLEGIRKRLKDSKFLEDKRIDLEKVANTLLGIHGVKLTLAVDKAIDGEIRIEFSTSAEPLRRIGKQLFLHALQSMGASLDELDSWKGDVEGNAYLLRGQLTEGGARMLLSPGTARMSGTAYADIARGSEPPPPNPEAIPSQRYLRSVTTLLDELKNEKKPKTVSQRGYWYELYATKIESLPMLNVDPELLEFGSAISSTLRAMANLGKIAKDQNAMIQRNQIDHLSLVTGYTSVGGGGYAATPWGSRGYGWNITAPNTAEFSNYRQVGNLCSQNAAVEKAYREDTWKNIAEATSNIRRKMVQKYKVEF